MFSFELENRRMYFVRGGVTMRNSKCVLKIVESKQEEFNIVLQKWEGNITGGAFKRTPKICSRGDNIYS